MRMQSFKAALILGAILCLYFGAAAHADPNPSANPILASIEKMGAKLYYIGTRGGLDGWFIVKDQKVQIAYSTPDKKSVIVGAMFGENGENITGKQVKTLVEGNKELTALMLGTSQETAAAAMAAAPAISTPVAPVGVPTGAATLSPGEKLYQDLTGATGVTVGSAAPRLLMVMDPNCPHCHATWRSLRDAVLRNTIQVKLIPIAAPGSEGERAATQLLRNPDPLNAWDKYVGSDKDNGDKTQLAGAVDQALVSSIRANHLLIDSWHITQTPYLVYRGKDGKVKIVIGEPDKISTILSDIAS